MKEMKEKVCPLDPLNEILENLLESMPELKAAAIVSNEGTPIVSALPKNISDIEMAAITATLISLAERAIIEMEIGNLEQIIVQGSNRNFVVLAAGEKALLTVSASRQLNLGLLSIDCKRACKKIANMI